MNSNEITKEAHIISNYVNAIAALAELSTDTPPQIINELVRDLQDRIVELSEGIALADMQQDKKDEAVGYCNRQISNYDDAIERLTNGNPATKERYWRTALKQNDIIHAFSILHRYMS